MKNQIKSNQVKVGIKLQNKLESELTTRVEMYYINLDIETNRKGYCFNIYDNKYDYKKVLVDFSEDKTLDCYINEVLSSLEYGKFAIHLANATEIFLLELLEENKIGHEFLYISEAELYTWDDSIGDSIPISEITNLNYNPENLMLEIVTFGDYKYWIDLKNKDIKMLELTHNEDTQVLKLSEEDIIHDILCNWFEEMTDKLLDCSLEEIIQGLKDELQIMIDEDCASHLEEELLVKLQNPSTEMLYDIDKKYLHKKKMFIESQKQYAKTV
ncbi:hypothetical protein [Anaeromicrobium sediminis]|uniref:Uncharacterized protein n=1 Tax=Anaeromicrobium sediminis TaxID=1478221 RepID=A0A267MPN5_9FIRM|nr:hypothetical protein [Anaeromicrobium sediminis]PAB60875.1 hypothetical protein CCE28_00125 [Anaeromicrobium sediminis]